MMYNNTQYNIRYNIIIIFVPTTTMEHGGQQKVARKQQATPT